MNPHTVFGPGSFRRAPVLTLRLGFGLLRHWWRPAPKWEKVHRYGRAEMRAMLDDSVARWGATDGVLCCKLMWHPFRVAMLEQGVDMSHWGVPVTWVRIQRDDRLGQAISYARASQTEQWTAEERAVGVATYDTAMITRSLATLADSEAGWDTYFASLGVDPYRLTYEQLDDDYEGTMRALLDHLGHLDTPVPERQLQRQATAESDEWRTRYVASLPVEP